MKEKINFYDWCIENKRQDLLDRWDYELNTDLPENTVNKRMELGGFIYLKCNKHIHESEKYNINSIMKMNILAKCKQCNSIGQWLIDIFGENALKKHWDYDKNIINPFNISCGSSNNKVYLNNFNKKDNIYIAI